ncbi:MAG: hypothetical protein II909_04620 [Kiritimatiellae bacterium]|nr:hypothetical protein [Kiritimatiellia bacterium]
MASRRMDILKLLGPIPRWRGETRSLDALGEMYKKAAEKAAKALAAAGDEPRTVKRP